MDPELITLLLIEDSPADSRYVRLILDDEASALLWALAPLETHDP